VKYFTFFTSIVIAGDDTSRKIIGTITSQQPV